VENSEYRKSNGVSLLAAKDVVARPFLLLMTDHIFDPAAAAALIRQPLRDNEVILGVDRKLDCIFDMDDATKVLSIGNYIVQIGKNIARYDAIDTGMFLCSPAIFDSLEAVMTQENCSLSDGMQRMASQRKLRAFDIGDALWQDIDTPEAYDFARTQTLVGSSQLRVEEVANA
jgi:1L-myo-inositol 1-phosphate cytidylyltransferase